MSFDGFPPGKTQTIALHASFFSDLLPLLDDLATLKVCLFCYYALYQKHGRYRYLRRADFRDNPELMRGLAAVAPDGDLDVLLDSALAQAVEMCFLLKTDASFDGERETIYLLNTAIGREALSRIASGHWQPAQGESDEILPERPTIFALYEDNIGALTPVIADHLKDAEAEYGYDWLAEAIRRAVENNVRRWTYIDAILKRWRQEGHDLPAEATSVAQAYRDNIDGKIGPMIREKLDDAERSYPAEWITDAIMLAVEHNAKNWRYIRAILERWKRDGRQHEKPQRTAGWDNPFAGFEWSDFED